MNVLPSAAQDGLRALSGADPLPPLERCAAIYAQAQPADAVYLIDEGLIKLTRSNGATGRIILAICGPGQVIGEEALSTAETEVYYAEAMSITAARLHRIPREALLDALTGDSKIGRAFVSYLLARKLELAEKVELLCLHDVEYRILHYLAQLATLLQPNGTGFQIPITQLELADLIGATRETTSTTLNQLERRGLLKLSRRLLTVPSPEDLRSAAAARISASPVPSAQGSATNVAS